jgi:predicted nucleic acid-binding Zn ribbon protein
MQCGGCGMVRGMERNKKQIGFVHIGSLVNDVLKSYRRESDSELMQVWQIWEGAVGAIIAQNAKPAAFKGSILLVHATSPAWIHQLQFLKKDMIDKLNDALGKPLIDDLKFKIGPL